MSDRKESFIVGWLAGYLAKLAGRTAAYWIAEGERAFGIAEVERMRGERE